MSLIWESISRWTVKHRPSVTHSLWDRNEINEWHSGHLWWRGLFFCSSGFYRLVLAANKQPVPGVGTAGFVESVDLLGKCENGTYVSHDDFTHTSQNVRNAAVCSIRKLRCCSFTKVSVVFYLSLNLVSAISPAIAHKSINEEYGGVNERRL